MKTIGIVIPFYNTPMWGQTSLYTLCQSIEKYRNDYQIDIMVCDNTRHYTIRGKKKNFIKAVSEPEYFKQQGVKIFQTPDIAKGHGTTLNFAARYFHYCDYVLCWETDIACFNDDWFETLLSYLEDGSWMAGYELVHHIQGKDNNDWYVMPNPGIYRSDVLLRLDAEVLKNKSQTVYYGENYSQSMTLYDIRSDKPSNIMKHDTVCINDIGVFSERRGFPEVSDLCPDAKGNFIRTIPMWYENGQWLFYRMLREGGTYKVIPCEDFYSNFNGQEAREKTEFLGGKFVHYWAGTRSWDFLTHPEANLSQINYVRPKIEKEMAIWRLLVPEEIRKHVPEVFNMDRNDHEEIEGLKHIDTVKMGNPIHHEIARETAAWFKSEFIDTDYGNLL